MTGHGKTHLSEEILSRLRGKIPVLIIDGKPGWEITYPGAPAGVVISDDYEADVETVRKAVGG